MNCPKCGSETRVVDSRQAEKYVRRRRHCDSCGERTTTHERYAFDEEWIREEGREEMRRELSGLVKAVANLAPREDSEPKPIDAPEGNQAP